MFADIGRQPFLIALLDVAPSLAEIGVFNEGFEHLQAIEIAQRELRRGGGMLALELPSRAAAAAFIDSLQAQYAAFLGTVAQGFLPLAGDASLSIEISPGIEINRLTDIALKSTNVKPGMQIIEHYYGMLEIHSPEQSEVRAAGAAILDEIGAVLEDLGYGAG